MGAITLLLWTFPETSIPGGAKAGAPKVTIGAMVDGTGSVLVLHLAVWRCGCACNCVVNTCWVLQALAGQVTSIFCGDVQMTVTTKDGGVWTWGEGDCSSLGLGYDGEIAHRNLPARVSTLNGCGVVQGAQAFGNSAAISVHGNLYMWGTKDAEWETWPSKISPTPALVFETNAGGSKLLKCLGVACSSIHTTVVLCGRGATSDAFIIGMPPCDI